jgi:7-carboxy-7-deazaguanine synthase
MGAPLDLYTTPSDAPILDATLRVTEIFHSLQGETSRVGLPTAFVRLTGCPLRCGYCDTTYAFHGGETRTLGEVLTAVGRYGTRYVTVTGGEPLAQRNCLPLLRLLCEAGYAVSLETSGALDVAGVDPRVAKILDIKTPGSGEVGRNRWSNLAHVHVSDELKFVLCDEADYDWARRQLVERQLDRRCTVLFSPACPQLAPVQLAEWILRDRLPVRFQMQLHKVLWGNTPGR